MSKLIVRRVLAFALDYILIMCYAALLFLVVTSMGLSGLSPVEGQLMGFVTLTLPVFLYFYWMEKSSSSATIGKRIMHISVQPVENKRKHIFIRNLLKFLPWEIAHVGVHWIVYYSNIGQTPPLWIWIVLILPQVLVLGYFVSILYSKGQSSMYDLVANTKIEINNSN
jgi:uncharacterized RDD family membrane protein YckC